MTQTPELVEREREVAALAALLAAAPQGEGRVAWIEGPAGIGKSALLAEARRRAGESGAHVLAARGSELEREFPFGVVRQLFEELVADPERRERAARRRRRARGGVFGALDGDGDASFAALHGLFWVALNLAAERPLVLAIDDLHWCDRPSLRFVAYLARRLEGQPILVGATIRTGEQGTDVALLGEIAHDPSTRRRPPGAAERRGRARARPRAARRRRRGAVLRRVPPGDGRQPAVPAPAADGARGRSRAPGRRERGRGAGDRPARGVADRARAARAAVRWTRSRSPAPSPCSPRARRCRPSPRSPGSSEARVADATGALARAEILRPETPLGFVHALVRDAVYQELPLGERELQHERAARVLLDAGAPAEHVAAHLLTAPRRGQEWVAEQLREAGRAAVARGAPESGVAQLRRALEEPAPAAWRPELLMELGLAEVLMDGRAAIGHLTEAYETLDDTASRALVAHALVPRPAVHRLARGGRRLRPATSSPSCRPSSTRTAAS